MRVLVSGAGGQLGLELQRTAPPGAEVLARERSQLDITREGDVVRALAELRPEIVLNAAAYTAVDRAEEEPDRAFEVNATGALNLARAAASVSARLIHVSTDFVFDGTSHLPYPPDAEPHPLGVYGASKLAGERHVLEFTGGRALVVRTAWVYARIGRNFVKTMLRLMAERDEIAVVADQIGTPTWARGLAEALWTAARNPELQGILHWTDAGVASWYDFAVAIQEHAGDLGLLPSGCEVHPVTTAEFPTAARRPPFAVLDKTASWSALGARPFHWQAQLRAMLRELQEHEDG